LTETTETTDSEEKRQLSERRHNVDREEKREETQMTKGEETQRMKERRHKGQKRGDGTTKERRQQALQK